MFLSDHGEEFREHGGLYHLTTVFDEQVRVPGWILYPSLAVLVLTPQVWGEMFTVLPDQMLAYLLALAVFVLIAAILLARGYALKSLPGPAATFATGTASGLFNGSFGIGGPPVILFFFSSPAGAAAGRASMIAFFLMTDVIGLACQGWSGLLSRATLWRALLFLPALTAGIWLGNRGFKNADSGDFRRWVLRLLMLLAVLTGGRALTQIL